MDYGFIFAENIIQTSTIGGYTIRNFRCWPKRNTSKPIQERSGLTDMENSMTKSKNMGKKFEDLVYKTFKEYPGVSIDRIPDQTMKYKGRKNVSDFVVFRRPFEYYIECKTVHGNTLPFANITQYDALLEKGDIDGVIPGVLCWWVDKDVTRWIPICEIAYFKSKGKKSVRYDENAGFEILGRKKKVFFDYDLDTFFY